MLENDKGKGRVRSRRMWKHKESWTAFEINEDAQGQVSLTEETSGEDLER